MARNVPSWNLFTHFTKLTKVPLSVPNMSPTEANAWLEFYLEYFGKRLQSSDKNFSTWVI